MPIDLDKVVKLLTFLRGNPILKPSRLSFRKPFYFMAIFAFDTANNFTLQRTRRNFAETEKLIHSYSSKAIVKIVSFGDKWK